MDEVKQHIDDNAKAGYIDWLRNEGPRPDEKILEHVAECSTCKYEIFELSELLDRADQTGKTVKNHKMKLNLVLRAVAVLAGVMAVALIVQFLKPEKGETEIAQLEGDSVQVVSAEVDSERDSALSKNSPDPEVIEITQHDTIKYAANFVQNYGLETLINARFRSENSDDTEKNMIAQLQKIGDELNLDLSNLKGSNVEFILISNTGKKLKNINTQEQKVKLKLNLDPGLYYWKIIRSDEILKVGKFRLFNN